MRWYFALNAASIRTDEMYARCVEAAVLSAVQNTTLDPYFIFDGSECALTRRVRRLGGKVIFHRTSLYDAIIAANPSDPGWQQIAQGAYLRLDVPMLDSESEFALYTDCDVLFLTDPALDDVRPKLFAVAPEFTHGDYENMNSGVMVMNLAGMREVSSAFRKFVIAGLAGFQAFDQGALRAFFQGQYEPLPETLNWKPYWGSNPQAEILHFHGPKPAHVKAIQAGEEFPAASVRVELHGRDPVYYAQMVSLWDRYVERAARLAPDMPDAPLLTRTREASHRYAFSIATCARWETDNIAEWILYHKSLGFEHFYIYCNDDDPTDLHREILPFNAGAVPLVTFHHFSLQGLQTHMLRHYLTTHRDETEWAMFLDVDEFLRLSQHASIADFVQTMPPQADTIYVNWLFFGNSGFRERAVGSTLLNYTRRSATPHVFTKSLTRTSKITQAMVDATRSVHFWHTWQEEIGEALNAVNVLGEPMHKYMVNFPDGALQFINEGGRAQRLIDHAVVHHYAFRSEDEFLRRIKRGLGGEFAGQQEWKTLYDEGRVQSFLAPLNEVEDLSLQRYWRAYLGRAWDNSIIPRPRSSNIAVGSDAIQSSVGPWSRLQDARAEAAGLVSGRIANAHQSHTDLEENPWWQVEFSKVRMVAEIRIYNRIDQPDIASRTRNLRIHGSIGGVAWSELYRRDSDIPFGGADGYPLIIRLTQPFACTLLRIIVVGHTYLHFDQVEVYEA